MACTMPLRTIPWQPTCILFNYFNELIHVLPWPPHAASDQSSPKESSSLISVRDLALCPLIVFSKSLLLGTGNEGSLLKSFHFQLTFFKSSGVNIRKTLREGLGKNWKSWRYSMWEARRAAVGMAIFVPFPSHTARSSTKSQTQPAAKKKGRAKRWWEDNPRGNSGEKDHQ